MCIADIDVAKIQYPNSTPRAILSSAKQLLIDKGWVQACSGAPTLQGGMTGPNCALMAVNAICYDQEPKSGEALYVQSKRILAETIKPEDTADPDFWPFGVVTHWNDFIVKGFDEIEAMFDKAIAAAPAGEVPGNAA